MSELTRNDLVEAARKAQQQVDGPLTRRRFIEIAGITEHHINRLFPEGRWTEIRELAEIDRHPLDRREYSNEHLLAEFHRVMEDVGDIPTWAIFASKTGIATETVARRFGGLQGTLKAYASWVKEHHPDSPVVELLQSQSRHEIPPPPSSATPGENSHWEKSSGPVFGPPIDFRGLRHAPINEQGVVYLFGIVSYELGFIVEAVHGEYPDCEAKRRIDKDRWQRVRIEFEFKSRRFRDHGHDPARADLIVCWEHNWPECPIEVLELRKEIDELEG